MSQQWRPKRNNRLHEGVKKRSRKGPIRHSRHGERRRHPATNRQATACRSRMAAVLEEEEGVGAIVQSKSTALRKIRVCISVGGGKVVRFVVSQLTNGGIFVSVLIVRRRKLTNGRRAVVDGGRASTRRRTRRGRRVCGPSPARTTPFNGRKKATSLVRIGNNAMKDRTRGNHVVGGAADIASAMSSWRRHERANGGINVFRNVVVQEANIHKVRSDLANRRTG